MLMTKTNCVKDGVFSVLSPLMYISLCEGSHTIQ